MAEATASSWADPPRTFAKELFGTALAALPDCHTHAVVPCSLKQLDTSPMCALLVAGRPVHRAVAFVKGTSDTDLLPLGSGLDRTTRSLRSKDVSCMLEPDSSKSFNLLAYCHEDQLLTFKLDEEAAIVVISAILVDASDEGASSSLVIEGMQKIRPNHHDAVKASLEADMAMSVVPSGESLIATDDALVNVRGMKRARILENWPSSPPRVLS